MRSKGGGRIICAMALTPTSRFHPKVCPPPFAKEAKDGAPSSPAAKRARGAKVDYNDPHVPRTSKQREHNLRMTSKKLSESMLKSYDCVLIATDHCAYDYDWIVKHSRLVVDTRNATANVKTGRKKIKKA